MKKQILLISIMLGLMINISGQTIDLTFTAIDSADYVQLDSIKVMNRTQGGSARLYWPDTTLTYEITPGDSLLYIGYATFYLTGVQETSQEKKQFQLFQNYPNPVIDQSTISMYIPEKGTVNVMVTDIQGRVFIATDWQLNKGNHLFRFTPGGSNLFFLTARWNGISRSIKILMTEPNTGKICMLDYTGSGNREPQLKESSLRVGFMQESGIFDSPTTHETFTFQFASDIPCLGTPTVEYEGQIYNTIQIFSQCWLKENLNLGTMIQGTEEMTDNGIMEKYCYDNQADSCAKYGGLYQWDEIMQYTTQPVAQGICPPNWHLPKDEEWKILGGAADSWYGIGDTIWDQLGYLNYNAADNLKTTSGWYGSWDGTDLYGFSALPGGIRTHESDFYHIGISGSWFTSSEVDLDLAWGFHFHGHPATWWRYYKIRAFSVRCIRDE